MTLDERLRIAQHQNDLNTFLFYEAKLTAAYRQAAYARARRQNHDHSRGASFSVQVDCE